MSTPATPAAAPASWPMLRAMVGVGLVCGVLIVAVYETTKPVIARNRAAALQAAIFEVLPDARSSRSFQLSDSGIFTAVEGSPPEGAAMVFAGYDDAGSLVGLAIEGAGMGYQDTVRILWGYSACHETVVGMQVLESKETPGLGDKISSDPNFRQNFQRLDVRLNPQGAALANTVVATKHGQKTDPWQVDGITGATISSVAVSEILNDSASLWLPRIRQNLALFGGER